MAAQKAFLNNFSVKLANNKKLFIISCVLSIFGMPMMVLGKVLEIYELEQSKINPEIYQYTGYEYYSLISVAAMVILLAVVIITAFNIFHYLYSRPLVDMVYALPVTSGQRFAGDYLAGLLTFSVPYIVSVIPSLIINAVAESSIPYWASSEFQNSISSLSLIMQAYICVFLIMLLLYTTTVLVLTFCGSMVESIGYTVIINSVVPLVMVILSMFFEYSVYGSSGGISVSHLLKCTTVIGGLAIMYSLIVDILNSTNLEYIYDIISVKWVIAYLVISAAVFFLAYFLYKKRKAEDVTKPFVFKAVYYILVGCICFCMSSGMVISFSSENSGIGSCIPWIISSIIVFFILDTIQNRGFKKFGQGILKYLAMTGGSILVFMIIYWTNGFGTAFYIPKAESVKSVFVSYRDISGTYIDLSTENNEDISEITDIHSEIIQQYSEFLDTKPSMYDRFNYTPANSTNYITITYNMRSGRSVSRSYRINNDQYIEICTIGCTNQKNIDYTTDNLKDCYENYSKYENPYNFYIYDRFGNDFERNISSKDLNNLLQAYEKDLKNASADDIMHEAETYCTIYNSAPVLTTFKNTIECLENLGLKITDEKSMERLNDFPFSQTNTISNIFSDMSVSESKYIYPDMSIEDSVAKSDYSYSINLKNKHQKLFIEMLIHAQPFYVTDDHNAMLITYNGQSYVLPAEYRSYGENFLKSLDSGDYSRYYTGNDYDYSDDYYDYRF